MDSSTAAEARVARVLHAAIGQAFSKDPIDPHGDPDQSLLLWAQHYLPNHFRKSPSALHGWLAQQMDRMRTERGAKVNVVGPRGAAKSTVATLAGVLRSAVEADEPYIWIISDTKSQAQAHLENVKAELIENERLAEAYPATVGRGPRWRSAGVELRNGVVIEAYGVGQRLRGRRRRANRPSLILCDDLQNDQHIVSPVLRESSTEWFHGALMKSGTKRTNVVNVATALHRDALAMRLTKAPGWRSRTFQSIVRWPDAMELWRDWETIYCDSQKPNAADEAQAFYERNRQEMNRGAEVLWPDEEDLYTLMRLRLEGGHGAFEREKQGSPSDPERCEWPESYFEDSVWFDDWPERLTLRVIALDPSKGNDARHGDYSAIVLLGVDGDGVLHVEADLARRPVAQMVADSVARCRAFRPDAFGVEANQWQQLLAGEFVAESHRQGLPGRSPCEIHNHTNKAVRIQRLGPYLSQRRLRFKRGSDSTALLVDQLREFPVGSHDDGPDALEMALRLAEEVWRTREDESGFEFDTL
ncbi:Terminase-like family protein [Planctomycetes bacterium MalM25]|nr:Terminase-like family protein [Planctomycetes bacterium MalM25]